jgi:hypothetical protein
VSEIPRRGATKKDDVQKTGRVEWSWSWWCLAETGRELVVTAAKGEVRLLLQVRGQWAPLRASTAALPDNSGRKCTWLAIVGEGKSRIVTWISARSLLSINCGSRNAGALSSLIKVWSCLRYHAKHAHHVHKQRNLELKIIKVSSESGVGVRR